MSLQVFDEVNPITGGRKITGPTTPPSILSPVSGGYPRFRIDSILVTSSSATAQTIRVELNDGVGPYLLGTATVPAGQGNSTPQSMDVLLAVLPANVVGIVLPAAIELDLRITTSLAANEVLTVWVTGGEV